MRLLFLFLSEAAHELVPCRLQRLREGLFAERHVLPSVRPSAHHADAAHHHARVRLQDEALVDDLVDRQKEKVQILDQCLLRHLTPDDDGANTAEEQSRAEKSARGGEESQMSQMRDRFAVQHYHA